MVPDQRRVMALSTSLCRESILLQRLSFRLRNLSSSSSICLQLPDIFSFVRLVRLCRQRSRDYDSSLATVPCRDFRRRQLLMGAKLPALRLSSLLRNSLRFSSSIVLRREETLAFTGVRLNCSSRLASDWQSYAMTSILSSSFSRTVESGTGFFFIIKANRKHQSKQRIHIAPAQRKSSRHLLLLALIAKIGQGANTGSNLMKQETTKLQASLSTILQARHKMSSLPETHVAAPPLQMRRLALYQVAGNPRRLNSLFCCSVFLVLGSLTPKFVSAIVISLRTGELAELKAEIGQQLKEQQVRCLQAGVCGAGSEEMLACVLLGLRSGKVVTVVFGEGCSQLRAVKLSTLEIVEIRLAEKNPHFPHLNIALGCDLHLNLFLFDFHRSCCIAAFYYGQDPPGRTMSCDFSSRHLLLAAGHQDGRVVIWRLRKEEVEALNGQSKGLLRQFQPCTQLAGCSLSGLRLVRFEGEQLLLLTEDFEVKWVQPDLLQDESFIVLGEWKVGGRCADLGAWQGRVLAWGHELHCCSGGASTVLVGEDCVACAGGYLCQIREDALGLLRLQQ